MKSMNASQFYEKQLQRQMDEDMEELIQAEQHTNRKLQPAYMNGDLFKEKKMDSEYRRIQRERRERHEQ
jgi:neutral trehalase